MIVRMSKVEIAGPKDLLEETIAILQEMGVLQIEPAKVGFIKDKDEAYIDSFLADEKTLTERLFLEDLRDRIDELFSCFPPVHIRDSYIEPHSIIETINRTVQEHLSTCRGLTKKKNASQRELDELNRYGVFLTSIESLLKDVKEQTGLDFIGLTLKNMQAAEYLRRLFSRMTGDRYELLTTTASDGTIIGLITAEKDMLDKVRRVLSDEDIPELSFPSSFGGLTFIEKTSYLRRRLSELSSDIDSINREIERLASRWGPIYKRTREWIDERLSILLTVVSLFETRMCFVMLGWIPSGEIDSLRDRLNSEFGGKVVVEEKEIHEEDVDRVPVILRNPAYFRPFELLTRILPLPKYASYDPTPFVGVFFPVFFGMILGDAGYGILLILVSLFLMRRFKKRKNIRDAAWIMLYASLYAIFFGLLYGEFFGELGHMLFGLEPICIERRTAVIPMLYFAITVGVVHVLLGLFLGFVSSLRMRTKKEALYRFLNLIIILYIIALVATFFGFFPGLLTRPIIIAILVITPFLLFTGGLLAPLELLKSIGNIISYARIMAIGLTSVLLAFIANRLAGLTGDIIIGVVVAGLLHLLNIILGVFSPTIHSLRLHYVEFFGKFVEPGGRKFTPLKKDSLSHSGK